MAPELFSRQEYGPNADVWSVGVLLFELLHGSTSGVRAKDVLEAGVAWELPPLPPSTNPTLAAMLRCMLVPDPAGRHDCTTLLQTPEAAALISMVAESPDSRGPGYLRLVPTGAPIIPDYSSTALDAQVWAGQGLPTPPPRLTLDAIVGRPGSSKTAAARELLRRATDEAVYPGGSVWIDARSRESIVSSLWETARANPVLRDAVGSIIDGTCGEDVCTQVVRWLGDSRVHARRWLIVFDGADSPEVLRMLHTEFLPDSHANGHVVITSRVSQLPEELLSARDCHTHTAGLLGPSEAALLLARTTMRTVRV